MSSDDNNVKNTPMSPELLRSLFDDVGRCMAEQGRIAEIALFGGSALMMMFDFRESTFDADYMLISGYENEVRQAAEAVTKGRELPHDWLNDAVSVYASDHPSVKLLGDFPRDGEPGLRVFHAAPEYIFAMKVLSSMRSSLESHDIEDIWNLIDAIPVATVEDAIDLVKEFYPKKKLPRRNELILQDIFEAKANNEEFSRELGW